MKFKIAFSEGETTQLFWLRKIVYFWPYFYLKFMTVYFSLYTVYFLLKIVYFSSVTV